MAEQLATLLAHQRENPVQLARMLVEKHLFSELQASELVQEYLWTVQRPTDNASPA